MVVEINEPWYLNVLQEIETFNQRLNEKIEKEAEQVKASKKKTELEIKLAQEIKLHNELTERLNKMTQRGSELDRVCAAFESRLTISESDQNRLDNARENYLLAKELTGIRFDYTAPPGVAKGYIKSLSRRLLQAFELPAGDPDALWSQIQVTTAPGWPNINEKENIASNKHHT